MVVAVPGKEFGLDGFLRISYALSEERMAMAVERISQFLSELS
jgi:aspartate/methionine/tyrosine aminotransferase